MELDFSEYSVEELFQSFESVDDIKYPDRALEILKLLMSKSRLSEEQILASYQTGTFLSVIGSLPVFSLMANDIVNTNNDVSSKLNRLLPML